MQKIALITGANKGIGLETARQLARLRFHRAHRRARLEARAKSGDELRSAGLDAQFLLLDPTDAASIERARTEVQEKHGYLDVLINNAGVLMPEDMALPTQVPVQALRDTYDVHVFAVHAVTQAFWPLLERSNAARVVNVSSAIGSLSLVHGFEGPVKDLKFIT